MDPSIVFTCLSLNISCALGEALPIDPKHPLFVITPHLLYLFRHWYDLPSVWDVFFPVNESVRRHISSHLCKLQRLIEILGANAVISPVLLLCHVSMSSLHIDPNDSNNQEVSQKVNTHPFT